MNSNFVKALAASLFATFAMTGCIADSPTELDTDPNADIDDEQEDVDTIDAPINGGASATSSCYDPIVAKPSSVKTAWNDTHDFTRYLKIEKYNMHVVGTASVSNWMMRERQTTAVSEMARVFMMISLRASGNWVVGCSRSG